MFPHYFDLPFKHFSYPNNCKSLIDCYQLAFLNEDHIMIRNTCKYLESDILNSTKRFIVFGSTCNMIDYLTYNENYYSFFYNHGFVVDEKGDISAQIRKYLLNFMYTQVISAKPFVMNRVAELKAKLDWDRYYTIGIQIRSGRTTLDTYFDFFLSKDDFKYFFVRAKELTEQAKQKQSKPVRWFLTCDNMNIRKEFQNKYKDMIISSGCEASHSLAEMYNEEQSDEMLCTLVDGYLVGSTDVAIITGRSTYGIWATNMNMHQKRYQVMKGSWKEYRRKKHSDVCFTNRTLFLLIRKDALRCMFCRGLISRAGRQHTRILWVWSETRHGLKLFLLLVDSPLHDYFCSLSLSLLQFLRFPQHCIRIGYGTNWFLHTTAFFQKTLAIQRLVLFSCDGQDLHWMKRWTTTWEAMQECGRGKSGKKVGTSPSLSLNA